MTWQAFEASDADRGEVAYSHMINLNDKNQPKSSGFLEKIIILAFWLILLIRYPQITYWIDLNNGIHGAS